MKMFSGFTCFDCVGRSKCILFASFWPPQKHTSSLFVYVCEFVFVVEIQTQVFFWLFFHSFLVDCNAVRIAVDRNRYELR